MNPQVSWSPLGVVVCIFVVVVAVVVDKPCLEMKEVAYLEQLILDARKGGIRFNEDSSPTIENITNWDLQSTIFLALQVMGSVGKYVYSRTVGIFI